MNLQHINLKIFVGGELAVDLQRFIEIFHRWVAEQALPELLIDVADYRHVPNGPSVVLIGHEAEYFLDQTGGRAGLRYNRKAAVEGGNADRFRQAFSAAAKVCQLLESEFSNLKFDRQELEFFINDRALAPNTSESYQTMKEELEAFLRDELGQQEAIIEHASKDPRELLRLSVKAPAPLDFSTIGG